METEREIDESKAQWASAVLVGVGGLAAVVFALPRWAVGGVLGISTIALVMGAIFSARTRRLSSRRAVQLQRLQGIVDRKVRERTMHLDDELEQYRAIVENLEGVAFEYDVKKQRLTYLAPQAARLFECELSELTPARIVASVHPDDRAMIDAVIARGYHAAPIDCRFITLTNRIVHVRTILSCRAGSRRVRGIALDMTREKQLEAELLQAQKLESVGRLAAGVAHEINSPIQYIADSVDFVRDAFTDVQHVLAKHRVAVDAAFRAEAVDLSYLLTNVPRALVRAGSGVEQVARIVRSTRSFAHDDKQEMTAVDLNLGIQNTLTLAQNAYRYIADVETDLGELPTLWCQATDIQQVLLAIIVNASQAIATQSERSIARRGLISITSRATAHEVIVAISDTGCGISDDIRDRVFEPFFTTHDVGKGTGQGLAVARSLVVERYHGSLTFETEVGKGTTFSIRLPLDANASGERVAA